MTEYVVARNLVSNGFPMVECMGCGSGQTIRNDSIQLVYMMLGKLEKSIEHMGTFANFANKHNRRRLKTLSI